MRHFFISMNIKHVISHSFLDFKLFVTMWTWMNCFLFFPMHYIWLGFWEKKIPHIFSDFLTRKKMTQKAEQFCKTSIIEWWNCPSNQICQIAKCQMTSFHLNIQYLGGLQSSKLGQAPYAKDCFIKNRTIVVYSYVLQWFDF